MAKVEYADAYKQLRLHKGDGHAQRLIYKIRETRIFTVSFPTHSFSGPRRLLPTRSAFCEL